MTTTPQAMLPEELEAPQRSLWHDIYPGVVVSAADPLIRGRLQVRVPQVYGDSLAAAEDKIADADLPWARPAFPVAGPGGLGVLDVPPAGAGVWVMFWQGNPEHPVWLGCFLGTGDAPARWVSSNGPDGPQTRIIRTPTGHTFELRWVPDQEEILLTTGGGVSMRLVDAPALGGPKVILAAGGFSLTLDNSPLQQRATVQTPASSLVLNDQAPPSASLLGPAVFLGTPAGTKLRLVDERFIAAFNAFVTAYNGHSHPPDGTTPPSIPAVPATLGSVVTADTRAS